MQTRRRFQAQGTADTTSERGRSPSTALCGSLEHPQDALGDAGRPLAEPTHQFGPAARIDLDDLRPRSDRHAVARQAAQYAPERCREWRGVDMRDDLAGMNSAADLEAGVKRAPTGAYT